jgi:hypothetical protein
MCENITNKYLDIDKINLIKQKLNKKLSDNPKLVIQPIKIPNNRTINVIQDGVLLAGTKTRVSKIFFKKICTENPDIKTLLYAGSSNGFGTVATAYGAYRLGLNCEVFLSTPMNKSNIFKSRQINTLQALGAKIHICSSWEEARKLEYSISTIKRKNEDNWNILPGYYIVPLGLNNELMTDLLSKQIRKAGKNIITDNSRIWLVSGSGGIAMSIKKAFPNIKLFIYPTGGYKYKRKVIEWSKKEKDVVILKNMNMKELLIDRPSYYSSVDGYDDLIFPYIKKYALDNDFIWNVSSDDYIF